MYRVLVVDDEKIEREGIKFLLSREEGEFEISEASNGRQALEILRNEEIDLLLTDIKMPHMDGLELAKKAKEEKEELQIVIFSGYNDFSFAQEAIRYGVKEYVLKPVDPDIFSETLEKVRSEIDKNKNRKIKDQKEQDFLQQYFLQNYIYTGKKEILEKAGEMINLDTWNQWHCAILVESSQNFFDTADENLAEDLSLEMLAEKVYLSSGYLSFIFKKETGMNLNRFIRVFRMEKAKELLCSTNMKVAQVSEKVGFSNVSYFCRSFREYYGSSPESYRKGTGDDEENPKEI